jgi:hypothetical protein
MFKHGDPVEILPEYQDEGDDPYSWVCVTDEEKGRVDISPLGKKFGIPPVYAVNTDQIVLLHKT